MAYIDGAIVQLIYISFYLIVFFLIVSIMLDIISSFFNTVFHIGRGYDFRKKEKF